MRCGTTSSRWKNSIASELLRDQIVSFRSSSGSFTTVRCRPGGAHIVDQMNYTSDIDLFREWARAFAVVLAIVDLLLIPFGTGLGIYTLWALLHRGTRQFFTSA